MSRQLLARATAYAESLIDELEYDDLRLSTPCEGWDVGRVVLHLADVADALVTLLSTGDLALPQPERISDPEPVRVLRARWALLEARLHTVDDAGRLEAATRAGAIELTAHGWDIAVARDPQHEIPAELASEVLEVATALIPDDLRGVVFGPPQVPPASARASDRLAAFLGRSPLVCR